MISQSKGAFTNLNDCRWNTTRQVDPVNCGNYSISYQAYIQHHPYKEPFMGEEAWVQLECKDAHRENYNDYHINITPYLRKKSRETTEKGWFVCSERLFKNKNHAWTIHREENKMLRAIVGGQAMLKLQKKKYTETWTHRETIESIVHGRKIATYDADRHTGHIHRKPFLAGPLGVAVEDMVTGGTQHAELVREKG